MDFVFKKLEKFSENDLKGLNRLLLQWSKKGYQMSEKYYKKLIEQSHVLAVFDGEEVVGTVTLLKMHKLSGVKGSLEHLIVDEKYQGKGLGRGLMEFVIGFAKKVKIKTLFLTCEPERTVANALYKKLGFKIKETNFYYLDIK